MGCSWAIFPLISSRTYRLRSLEGCGDRDHHIPMGFDLLFPGFAVNSLIIHNIELFQEVSVVVFVMMEIVLLRRGCEL
jgi:hypothetical protein